MEIKNDYTHLFDEGDAEYMKERITARYSKALENIESLLEKCKVAKFCEVNDRLLYIATLDYFDDVFNLKKAHGITHIQAEKKYAHQIFWCLRTHPIQIINSDGIPDKLLHINESIFSFLLVRWIAEELKARFACNIQIDNFIDKLENHRLMVEFQKKLYYTFRRRTYTSKSLLTMVEAFVAAAQFVLEIT